MIIDILLTILAPILILVGLGAILQKRFNLDLNSLSKLNIYLFVPAFIFEKVYKSKLAWADMAGVAVITIGQILLLGMLVWIVGRAARAQRQTLAAVAMAVMFYNSGNYGLPLAELAYPGRVKQEAGLRTQVDPSTQSSVLSPIHTSKDGGAVQAFVVMTMNVMTFTVGLAIAAVAGDGDARRAAKTILQMPSIYALAAALCTRLWLSGDPTRAVPIFVSKSAEYLANGLVPIALVTLGAQLAKSPRWPRWKPVSFVLFVRLLIGPALMTGVLYLLHRVGPKWLDLWPWPAELLILTASVPTAVNTLLLTLELDGDAELAADCVFWTTVLSCLTITGWLIVLRTAMA